jgi:archaellum component FlaF (FlaF/FlaG flagellin family)
MRGISTAIFMILFLMVSISITYMLYISLAGTFSQAQQTGSDASDQTLMSISSCIRAESASDTRIFVRNCGEGHVTQQNLGVYIDETYMGFSMSPSSLSDGETGTVTLNDISGLTIGNHILRITSPRASSEILVEAYGSPISLRMSDSA